MKFVDLPFEAFEIQPPSGIELRRLLREYAETKEQT
jgi:hypothetical protein